MSGSTLRTGATAVLLAITVVLAGCGDDGESSTLSDEDIIERLEREGHNREGAECVLDRTALMGVDLGAIIASSRITPRERDFVTSAVGYCVERYGPQDLDAEADGLPGAVEPTDESG